MPIVTGICFLAISLQLQAHAAVKMPVIGEDDGFYGMWTLSIEGGGVGWLALHHAASQLDRNIA